MKLLEKKILTQNSEEYIDLSCSKKSETDNKIIELFGNYEYDNDPIIPGW